MEENNFNQTTTPIVDNSNNNQQDVPNDIAILVLGIVSIITCWCWGIVGLITGGIGLYLALKASKIYNEAPGIYKESSFKLISAGKICAIIGLVLSGLYLIYTVVSLIIGGAMLLNPNMFH